MTKIKRWGTEDSRILRQDDSDDHLKSDERISRGSWALRPGPVLLSLIITNQMHQQKDNKKPRGSLFSRPVSRQVPSAQVSLTSVFGMGTGVASPLSSRGFFHYYYVSQELTENCIESSSKIL